MANLPDGSGDAYSNLVQGDGTASLAFKMPGTVPLAVSSVVATVDNTAGADTTATLVIRDPSGEVIATKRQAAVVDAGATTTATWALRLDDDTVKSGGGTTGLERLAAATGTTVTAGTSANIPWGRISGDVLLDFTTPAEPTIIAAGMYAFSVGALVSAVPGPIANGAVMYGALVFDDFGIPAEISNQIPYSNALGTVAIVGVSVTRPFTAGTGVHFTVENLGAGTATFQLIGFLARLS